jgi:hypothetical protein
MLIFTIRSLSFYEVIKSKVILCETKENFVLILLMYFLKILVISAATCVKFCF